MITHISKIRPVYSETDKMNFVHHSNYVRYYENARWELFRQLGIQYKHIEDAGIIMPVIQMEFSFIKPAFYDDELTVKTMLKKGKQGVKLKFHYELYNAVDECINRATVTTAFVDKTTNLPCRPPEYICNALL